MIGTRGVPARYGGFETAVEEVGSRLVQAGHTVTVYCRERGLDAQHEGMTRVYLPALPFKTLETLSHSLLSACHAIVGGRRPDVAVVFNSANAPFIRLLQTAGIPVVVHVDGLEWKRSKWGRLGSAYYRWAERLAVRRADALIADARGIASYLRDRFGVDSTFIPYGAPYIQQQNSRLGDLGLKPGSFHLCVARMEPENHVREIVAGYARSQARLPLVVVGAAPYAEQYAKEARDAAEPRAADVRFVGSIWDQDLLNELYSNCASYLHGHSVGGTNPSLLRALGACAPVLAYDVVFNREVTNGSAWFFSGPDDVAELLQAAERQPAKLMAMARAGQAFAVANYQWDVVASDYEKLCQKAVAARVGPLVSPL